jgi:hypothetical protein
LQRHAPDPKTITTLPESRRPVTRTHGAEIWKERPGFREIGEDFFNLFAEPNLRRCATAPACLHPKEADDPVEPVHVLGL